MQAVRLALFVALLPCASFAQPDVLLVSPSADYAADARVPDDVKKECTLPAAQSESVLAALNAAGIAARAAPSHVVPAQGRFLELEITGAISEESVFVGHRRQVTTAAHLFVDGKEVAQTTRTRDAMGGSFPGERGSCRLLQGCTNALGKDIAEWMKSQPAK